MNFLKKILVALLTLESRLILAKYKPYIIAVTGSVGKTSTKDAIYSVLKDQSRHVRKSEKSLNTEFGLPLTIIGVPNAWRNLFGWYRNLIVGLKLIFTKSEYPDTLVLEIGADHPGDISRVSRWLRADIVVITQVSSTPVHVEFFASPEEVFEEKASLVRSLKKGGTLVLFADNEKVLSIADRVKNKDAKIISFGTVESALIKGSADKTTYDERGLANGFSFFVTIDGVSSEVFLKGIIGRTHTYPLLAAAAVARAKNIPIKTIVKNMASYDAPKSRMNLIAGMNGSVLIDDTYNSSPDAAEAALHTLKELSCTGAKIAVLGDMMELGQYASEQHRAIGEKAAKVANVLITVGQRSRATADEAIANLMPPGNVHSFDKATEAGEYLKPFIKQGDVVLIKGSQSIRLERTVETLMAEPAFAKDLLVRQEPEWLAKK